MLICYRKMVRSCIIAVVCYLVSILIYYLYNINLYILIIVCNIKKNILYEIGNRMLREYNLGYRCCFANFIL